MTENTIFTLLLIVVFLGTLIYGLWIKPRRFKEEAERRKAQIRNVLSKRRYDLITALVGYIHERVCDTKELGCSDPVLLSYRDLKAFFAENGLNLTDAEATQLINNAAKEWGLVNFSPKDWEEKVLKRFFGEIKDAHLKFIDGFIKRHRHEEIVDEAEFEKFMKLLDSESCHLSRQELLTFFTLRMFHETLKRFDTLAEKATNENMDVALLSIAYSEGDELTGNIKLLSDALRRHGFSPKDCEFESILAKIDKQKQKNELDRYKADLLTGKPHISIEQIDLMDGTEFERFLEELFKNQNYRVEHKGKAGDQGADLIIERGGERIVVQAKCYSDKVSNTAVQEVVAAIKHYRCDSGMVVTNNYFQDSALELARSNNIKLVDRDELINWILKYY